MPGAKYPPVNADTPVAVIELFTSEGCSSCPPADKLLAKVSRDTVIDGAKVITLAFHVDYWDYLGWKDIYSATAFSNRQRMYVQALNLNGAYTPQMVVNGTTEFVGADEDALHRALRTVANEKLLARFTKAVAIQNAGGTKISYALSGDISNCDINIALVSAHESSAVKRGENRGRQLEHTNVVKEFVTQKAVAQGEIQVPFSAKDGNWFYVVYLQNRSNKRIVAAIKL